VHQIVVEQPLERREDFTHRLETTRPTDPLGLCIVDTLLAALAGLERMRIKLKVRRELSATGQSLMEARANAGIEHEPKPNAFAVNDAEALKNDQVQRPYRAVGCCAPPRF